MNVSNTKPKLQNNRFEALHTIRQYSTIFLTILLLGNLIVHAQDLPRKNTVSFPIKTTTDTLITSIDSLINPMNERVADTVKTDTIAPPKEMLEDIIDYYGDDYVFLDRKENKVYLYNKAYITYQDMRIEAGLIIMDLNNNEVLAKGIDSAGIYNQRPIFTQGGNRVEPDL